MQYQPPNHVYTVYKLTPYMEPGIVDLRIPPDRRFMIRKFLCTTHRDLNFPYVLDPYPISLLIKQLLHILFELLMRSHMFLVQEVSSLSTNQPHNVNTNPPVVACFHSSDEFIRCLHTTEKRVKANMQKRFRRGNNVGGQ